MIFVFSLRRIDINYATVPGDYTVFVFDNNACHVFISCHYSFEYFSSFLHFKEFLVELIYL